MMRGSVTAHTRIALCCLLFIGTGLFLAVALSTCTRGTVVEAELREPVLYADSLYAGRTKVVCADSTLRGLGDGCPPFGGVAFTPYGYAAWHPLGRIIGFDHTPLERIDYPYGEDCQGRMTFDMENGGYWLINSDGTEMRRVSSRSFSAPAWSPDGQWLAFDIQGKIHKIRFTGEGFDESTLTQLTFEGRYFFPAWSPDGKWIAYSNTIGDTVGAWLSPTDGSGEKQYFAYGAGPQWFPDGQRLLYGNRGFWVEMLDHSSKIQIYADSTNRLGSPRISPDGEMIAFTLQPLYGLVNIWVMNSDGSGLRQITTEGTTEWVSWSADGRKLVYTQYRSDNWSYCNGTIWTVDVFTGEKRQLTFNYLPAE